MRAPNNGEVLGREIGDRAEREEDVAEHRARVPGVAGNTAGTAKVGLPYCVKPTRVVGTR